MEHSVTLELLSSADLMRVSVRLYNGAIPFTVTAPPRIALEALASWLETYEAGAQLAGLSSRSAWPMLGQ